MLFTSVTIFSCWASFVLRMSMSCSTVQSLLLSLLASFSTSAFSSIAFWSASRSPLTFISIEFRGIVSVMSWFSSSSSNSAILLSRSASSSFRSAISCSWLAFVFSSLVICPLALLSSCSRGEKLSWRHFNILSLSSLCLSLDVCSLFFSSASPFLNLCNSSSKTSFSLFCSFSSASNLAILVR